MALQSEIMTTALIKKRKGKKGHPTTVASQKHSIPIESKKYIRLYRKASLPRNRLQE